MGLVEVTNRIVTTCSSYFKLAVIETRVGNPLTNIKRIFKISLYIKLLYDHTKQKLSILSITLFLSCLDLTINNNNKYTLVFVQFMLMALL